MTVRSDVNCSIPDCGKHAFGRGWCSMHYRRWRLYDDPLHETRRYTKQGEKCSAEGCERQPKRRGMCEMHVRRALNHGEATDPRERQFWAKVDRRGPADCWPWTGYMQPNGYGSFGVRQGSRLTHRIAYAYVIGSIPDGLVLDHLCHTSDPECADNAACPHRRCCNPEHLEPVTRRENLARGRGGDSWGYVAVQRTPKPKPVKPERCTECNGDKTVYKRGLCRPCYRKWSKDPARERPAKPTPEQRFWAKVQKTPTCWLWTAAVNPGTGYGQFTVATKVQVQAHRYSFELHCGPVPEGHDVHHTCHVRDCVNPAHLQAVTRAENLRFRKVRRT